MRALVIFAFVAFAFALCGQPAAAAPKRTAPKPDQVRALYMAPKDTKYSAMYDVVRKQRLLEKLAELLSPIKLPRVLTLKLEGCDGVANAYYEEDTVTICYEYLDFIVQSAPKGDAPRGTTPDSAWVGPLVDVTLHEAGHAVFDMLQIPVFGREEDAADQFSAYVILNFSPRNAQALILSVAYLGAKEAKEAMEKSNDIKAFADSHGLPAQRYFNILCIAYGSNPKLYAGAVTRGQLTAVRAEGCEYEYEMLERAIQKLIRPHVDQALLRKLRRKALFGLGDAGQKPAAPPAASPQ